jgi:mannose-6-phosphate isomerase
MKSQLNEVIVFEPLFMERVWGGRRLETMLGKRLPSAERIGESWELVDREEAQSVVHSGPFKGLTLHDLWSRHREEVFGAGLPDAPRFPLLFKLLDAQERLSVQVHPPADCAKRLGGEPKTEMWYLLDSLLGADIYAGLRAGVSREQFEAALGEGTVGEMVHRIPVQKGDAVFIPSGRVHAIGAGNLVFEVQQNSDTTYRVFDWNRLGLDGRPRQLHVQESLESIDFSDAEPRVAEPQAELLTECTFFSVERWDMSGPRSDPGSGFSVWLVLEGEIACAGGRFSPGQFFLMPASMEDRELRPGPSGASALRTTIPHRLPATA